MCSVIVNSSWGNFFAYAIVNVDYFSKYTRVRVLDL